MKRQQHKHANPDPGEAFAKMKAMRSELAKTYNLPEVDPRIAQAAIVKLNQQNWEARCLLGIPVPASELAAYTETIAQILGPPPTSLKVRFVHVCFSCKTENEIDPDTLCAKCKAALPPKP